MLSMILVQTSGSGISILLTVAFIFSILFVLIRGGSMSPDSFLSSVLLWLVIIVAVVRGGVKSGGGVVDLTGDEDPTYEDRDIGMDESTGVSVSLGGGISQESNIGDSDNTGDGGTITYCGIGDSLA
nr:hypothetical protein [Tanacetum cinerariifolium]